MSKIDVPSTWNMAEGTTGNNIYGGPDAAVSIAICLYVCCHLSYVLCHQILTLTEPIEFSWKMRPVCLPSDPSVSYEGEVGQATGWGAIENNKSPTNLMEVDVKVISIETCQNSYRYVTEYVIHFMKQESRHCYCYVFSS